MEIRARSLLKTLRGIPFGLLVLLAASCASAERRPGADGHAEAALFAPLGAPEDPIPMDGALRRGTLPNGLRYYILENRKPEGRAFLRLAVNAGSVLEEDGEQGLAHFVEHMAFNGTERFPKSELVDYLRSLGMRFGPEVNAYTSFNETVYGIEVPVESGGTVPERALAVLDDWTRAIRFDAAEVEAERSVILEEHRTGLGAMDRVRRKILPVLFRGSPYADRLPIGLPEVIAGAPPERLAAFYRRWYRSDNMALVLVGDFNGEKLEASLGEHFRIGAAAGTLERPVYELPPPVPGNRAVAIALDDELPYGFVQLHYKRPPRSERFDLRSRRRDLAEELIDRMLSQRFSEAAAKQETPYVGAGAGESRYGLRSRYYTLSAVPEPLSAEATLAALLRGVELVRRFGFSAAELERAGASVLSDLRQEAAEKDRRDSGRLLEAPTAHFLRGEPAADPVWELRAAEVFLPGLGVEEIGGIAAGLFADDDLTVVLYGPTAEGNSMPDRERILAMIREAAAADLAPPEDDAPLGELLSAVPEPGFVAAESTDPESGAVLWTLGNGARVLHLPTKNRNDDVSLYALARGGQSDAEDGDAVSAALAADLAAASGIGPHSRSDLQKLLAGRQVSLNFRTTQYFRSFQGSAAAGDLEYLFKLLHLSISRPRIDPDAAGAAMDRTRTLLLQRKDNPEAVFSDEVVRTVNGGHPRLEPLTAEALSRLSLDQAASFLRRFLSAGDFLFVFVGNIDAPALRSFTERYLASLPAPVRWDSWKDLGVTRPRGVERAVYKGEEDKSQVFLGWYSPAVYSEQDAAVVAVLDSYLDIRLTQEIRERLGGVYSIGSSVSLGAVPLGELSLTVRFSCAPDRADALAAAVEAELASLAEGRIDGTVMTKAVEALKRSHETALQSNTALAFSFANLLGVLELPAAALYARPGLYEKATPEDLVRVSRSLREGGPLRVTLYPERPGASSVSRDGLRPAAR